MQRGMESMKLYSTLGQWSSQFGPIQNVRIWQDPIEENWQCVHTISTHLATTIIYNLLREDTAARHTKDISSTHCCDHTCAVFVMEVAYNVIEIPSPTPCRWWTSKYQDRSWYPIACTMKHMIYFRTEQFDIGVVITMSRIQIIAHADPYRELRQNAMSITLKISKYQFAKDAPSHAT